MRFLGRLRGAGDLRGGNEPIGRAEYDLEGYLVRSGAVVASGEIRMAAEALTNAFGRRDLQLATDDGRTLLVRFSGRRLAPASDAAHVDVSGELPTETQWRR